MSLPITKNCTCTAIDWILERTVQVTGIQVGDRLYTDLDYADDVVLMAEETDSLRASLEQFHENAYFC